MASNLRVDSIVPSTSGNVSIGTATGGVTIPGDLGVAGTLTYEDVTNIDSVGVITARGGIKLGATGANTLISGNATGIGIGTDNPAKKLEVFDATQGVIRIRGGAGGSNSSRKADLSLFASGAREYVVRADASDAAFKIVDVSASNAERLLITSTGLVGLDNTSPQGQLHIGSSVGTSDREAIIILNNGGATGQEAGIEWRYENITTPRAKIHLDSSGQDLRFATANTERLRITSDGKLLIKTLTDVFGGTDFGVKGQISIANDNAYRRAYLSGSNNHLYFWNGSNQPYISSSGLFVNASDQSLKKDITDLTYGIDVLKNLKPRKYKMKADDKEQIGFIAQEVESVIPEVVDAGDTPDGTEQKGLSYGNLTAVLTKALQEAVTKIETLEAKVAALEGS